jgi:hypothetical protein
MDWGNWPVDIKQKWEVAFGLGDPARKVIKGNSVDYYLTMLNTAREKTLIEFRKRDDQWLAITEKGLGRWNNHAKWFHVAEHESNHNGQFKFLRSRIPGAKTPSG